MKIENKHKWIAGLLIGLGAVLILVSVITFYLVLNKPAGESAIENIGSPSQVDPVCRVTFAAVGDNLIHDTVYKRAATADGYDFRRYYNGTKDEIAKADVAYVNFETIAAGVEVGGLSGYPMFNGPTEIIDAIYETGFDWISTASNHSLDRGEAGVRAELEYIKKFPDLVQTGMAASQEEADTPTVVDVNGVRIGLETFTYGLNGLVVPAGKDYMVNIIDDDLIRTKVEKLNAVSDVQIVSMHWGVEYATYQNAEQERLAKLLADLGVDVVVGEHPHVIQPVEWVDGLNGQKTLVIYSLGNYLSSQDEPMRMLGLMAKWQVDFNTEDKSVSVSEIELWPTVTFITKGFGDFNTMFLKDYTNEIALQHTLPGATRAYYLQQSKEILGDEFKVVIE